MQEGEERGRTGRVCHKERVEYDRCPLPYPLCHMLGGRGGVNRVQKNREVIFFCCMLCNLKQK